MTTFNGPAAESGESYVPQPYQGMSEDLKEMSVLADHMAGNYPVFVDFFKLYHAKERLEELRPGALDDETIAQYVEVKAFFDKLLAYFTKMNTTSENIRNGRVYRSMNEELMRQMDGLASKLQQFYDERIPPYQPSDWPDEFYASQAA
jgi:hypothetical protein